MTELGSLTPDDWAFWDRWMKAQRHLNHEFDGSLQQALGLSKAEFSILVTLNGAPEGRMRVSELAAALAWDKGRVSHQLTRMESRGHLARDEHGAKGRRTGVSLTESGRDLAQRALRLHSENVRRLVLDTLAPHERAVIDSWSKRVLGPPEPE